MHYVSYISAARGISLELLLLLSDEERPAVLKKAEDMSEAEWRAWRFARKEQICKLIDYTPLKRASAKWLQKSPDRAFLIFSAAYAADEASRLIEKLDRFGAGPTGIGYRIGAAAVAMAAMEWVEEAPGPAFADARQATAWKISFSGRRQK